MSEIKLRHLEVVLMPNGEIICNGKTIGWENQIGQYLKEPEAERKTQPGLLNKIIKNVEAGKYGTKNRVELLLSLKSLKQWGEGQNNKQGEGEKEWKK